MISIENINNLDIEIFIKNVKKLKKQFNVYENKHGMSLKLKEISIRIITLEVKLTALLGKNQFKIKWYRELPSKFEAREYVINEKDLENAKNKNPNVIWKRS